MVHGEVDAFDSHERGVDTTTFDSMKQGRKLFSDPCTVELKTQTSVSWCCAWYVAVCETREVTSVEEGHDVECVIEKIHVC